MTRFQDSRSRLALLAALTMLAAALAGCMGGGQGTPDDADGDTNGGDLFASALAGPGPVYEPVNTESTVRLKLLTPDDPQGLAEGEQTVRVLLYDSAENTPVTDADFVIEARMPAMGHGTAPESAPEHTGDGIYEGMTTWSMPGKWILNLDPQLADGTILEFDVEARVGGESGGMDGHDNDSSMDHDDHDMGDDNASDMDHDGHEMGGSTYASYEDAKGAHGRVYAPVTASESTVRLKLLEPMHPGNATTGTQNVTVLLFDNATDAPVTDATFAIEAWMDDHDHGTSPEHAPEHDAHGVYAGSTTWSMAGNWTLNLDVTLADGSTLAFDVPVTVTESGGGGHDMDDGEHMGH